MHTTTVCRLKLWMTSAATWLILMAIANSQWVCGQDAASTLDAQQVIDEFVAGWDEGAWEQEFRVTPEKYMRASANEDWKLRFQAIQSLISLGSSSVEPLMIALDSDNVPLRILAAQTLGFLNAPQATDRLLRAASEDGHPAVRLYAIDSYAMLGGDVERLAAATSTEKNRDVKMHVNYAREREAQGFSAESIDSLKKFSIGQVDTARLGEPAPLFDLESANGGRVSLSDFRGKSAVVLVFIYGDT